MQLMYFIAFAIDSDTYGQWQATEPLFIFKLSMQKITKFSKTSKKIRMSSVAVVLKLLSIFRFKYPD